jgi:hypothetical protein
VEKVEEGRKVGEEKKRIKWMRQNGTETLERRHGSCTPHFERTNY